MLRKPQKKRTPLQTWNNWLLFHTCAFSQKKFTIIILVASGRCRWRNKVWREGGKCCRSRGELPRVRCNSTRDLNSTVNSFNSFNNQDCSYNFCRFQHSKHHFTVHRKENSHKISTYICSSTRDLSSIVNSWLFLQLQQHSQFWDGKLQQIISKLSNL